MQLLLKRRIVDRNRPDELAKHELKVIDAVVADHWPLGCSQGGQHPPKA
jgi:hypothetical protein